MDDKKYYRMKVQEVLDDLQTTVNGLETTEAARRTDQYLYIHLVFRFIHICTNGPDGKAEPITEKDHDAIIAVNEGFSKKALRVLAIAYRPLDQSGKDYALEEAEKDLSILGLVGMTDPPREGVREAIAVCHGAGIRTFIMTGDHQITAQAVGMEIGLAESGHPSPVITGSELKAMDDSGLAGVMSKEKSLIFSRVDPEDKLRIVELLEKSGKVVAVTGDGVNDAPSPCPAGRTDPFRSNTHSFCSILPQLRAESKLR